MRSSLFALILGLIISGPTTGYAAIKQAPTFVLPGRHGECNLSSYRGKVVYLDFWASWCPPCRKSFPWMNEIQSRYRKQGLVIIAVNLDENRKLADAFLDEFKSDFTIAFDANGDVADKYQVIGMPSSYLIGRDGNIHESYVGFMNKDKAPIEAAIRRLLSE